MGLPILCHKVLLDKDKTPRARKRPTIPFVQCAAGGAPAFLGWNWLLRLTVAEFGCRDAGRSMKCHPLEGVRRSLTLACYPAAISPEPGNSTGRRRGGIAGR